MEKEKLIEYMRKVIACHNENPTDCLGRECCDCPHDYPVETIELIESALELLEQDRWHSVAKEGNPKDSKDVLCFSKIGLYFVASHGKMYPGSNEVGWITSDFVRLDESVILAWRPLPAPYQEDEA